jgi:hypothetical protein
MFSSLISFITRRPRYVPKFETGPYWVFNVFRVYEQIFGRRYGIRCESTSDDKGNVQFYTWEAALMYVEGKLRSFKLPEFSRVHVPAFQMAGVPLSFTKSPYLFAITAPSNNASGLTSFGSGNPSSQSMTPSGTDRVLLWYSMAYSNGGGQYGSTASATFNTSESATSVGAQLVVNNAGGLGSFSAWYRVAPTATTANATVTISNSQSGGALYLAVYSGVDQTTPTHGWATASSSGSANSNVNVTTTVANAYVTGWQNNNGVAVSLGTGMTARVTDGGGVRVQDSGELASPQTFNWNAIHSSIPWGCGAFALSPVASASSNSGFFRLMM